MSNYPRIGIGVLIFNSEQQLLLGERLNGHGAYTWAPAGGHLEHGESFEGCAIREVYEETGLVISLPHFFAVTNDIFSEEKHYISILMRAECPPGQIAHNREPDKTRDWQWFSLHSLPEPLFSPLQQLKERKGYGNILAIPGGI